MVDTRYSFPGGGEILFTPSERPGYPMHGVGIVESDGTLRHFNGPLSFPYWDPHGGERVLTLSSSERPLAVSSRLKGNLLKPTWAFPAGDASFTFPSLDGRFVAYLPLDSEGRLRGGTVRVIDRRNGRVRVLRSDGLIPTEWTPDDRLLAIPQRGGVAVQWDPNTGNARPFLDSTTPIGPPSWSPDGTRFAAAGGHEGSKLVIGTYTGVVLYDLPVQGSMGTPTWSPDGRSVAYIARPTSAREAVLHIVGVQSGIDAAIANGVSDAFWASWSPDGQWLLIEDWTRDRWLFVSADGSYRLPYPWLGDFPRWCCPSSPAVTTQIPVS